MTSEVLRLNRTLASQVAIESKAVGVIVVPWNQTLETIYVCRIEETDAASCRGEGQDF
jgi:hypothetical protein